MPDQLELARGAGTKPSLPSLVPSTALLEHEARATLSKSIPFLSLCVLITALSLTFALLSLMRRCNVRAQPAAGPCAGVKTVSEQEEKTNCPQDPKIPLSLAIFFPGFQINANSDQSISCSGAFLIQIHCH